MRRLVLAVGAIGAIGVSAVLAAVVSSAAAQPTVVPATVSFSMSASVAGGIKSAELGDQVTFVFTNKNTGNVASTPPFPRHQSADPRKRRKPELCRTQRVPLLSRWFAVRARRPCGHGAVVLVSSVGHHHRHAAGDYVGQGLP
jgi:hypothetical protein